MKTKFDFTKTEDYLIKRVPVAELKEKHVPFGIELRDESM